MTRAEGELLGRIGAMARVMAVIVARRGECAAGDLIAHGFAADEVHTHWSAIVERADPLIAAERGITQEAS